jgi:hypothetical protein
MYRITTQKELSLINNEYFELHPEHIGLTWAACSVFINKDGTATSMIECDGCKAFDYCKLKKDTPVWFYNSDIHKERERLFRELLN